MGDDMTILGGAGQSMGIASGLGAGVGYLGNSAQNSAYPQMQAQNAAFTSAYNFSSAQQGKEYPEYDITVRGTENGFIVEFEDKTYICATAIEVSERIATCMVEDRLDK